MTRPITYAPETREAVLAQHAAKTPYTQIAAATGLTIRTISRIISNGKRPARYFSKPTPDTKKTKRTCLKCRKPFSSAGVHNQICAPCAHQNSQSGSGFDHSYAVARARV